MAYSMRSYAITTLLLSSSGAAFLTSSNRNVAFPLFMAERDDTSQVPSQVSKEDKDRTNKILAEINDGTRSYPDWFYAEYQELTTDVDEEDDDPSALDPATLGKWDNDDLEGRLEYEFYPEEDGFDPNDLNPKFEHIQTVPVDEEGVEVGYDPIFGRSNPIDQRTIVNPQDSYVIDDESRDDAIVTPTFHEGDLELDINADFKAFRKSLKIVDTYIDPYLNMEVPRHQAKWYGYPEIVSYPKKPDLENRFTKPENKTDFSKLTPYQARKKAIELARSKNNEWLPKGKSVAFHNSRTDIFSKKKLKVGSFMKGDINIDIKNKIQSALDVLGSSAELLEISEFDTGTVFRFHYHGLIKNKRGMAAWTETLIRDCGVECTGVVFETGWRKRDPYYDGGDPWFGPY